MRVSLYMNFGTELPHHYFILRMIMILLLLIIIILRILSEISIKPCVQSSGLSEIALAGMPPLLLALCDTESKSHNQTLSKFCQTECVL